MQKQIIGALVGASILFIWQFLSFGMLNLHGAEGQYTPNQEQILECLSQNLTESGQYFLPGVPPGSSAEEYQAAMESGMGKPWAQINYHPKMEMSMPLNMARGFAVDFLSVLLLVWLLMRMRDVDMKTAVIASLSVGAIGYMTIVYLDSVWYETSTLAYLLDAGVSWGLVGAWLGFWLTRK